MEVAVSDRLAALPLYQPERTSTSLWRTLSRQWVLMVRATQSRQILAELDPRLLKDIGVSRSEAIEEARRAPWDLIERQYWR